MPSQISVTNNLRQQFTTTLDSQRVSILLWWQPLTESWHYSLVVDGNLLAAGLRIVTGSRPTHNLIGFRGEIVVFGQGPLLRDSWGNTHEMYYYSEEEIQ